MTDRPLLRLSNLELIDIINHPERFTEELVSDAQQELELRKVSKEHQNSRIQSGGIMDTLLFKTAAISTPIIVWINILVFLLVGFNGVDFFSPTHTSLFRVGGMQQYHFLNGDWWRPVSSMFLHSGAMHIGFNMFALIQIGPIAEHLIGSKRYTIIYIICGLMGSLASISLGSNAVGVGASGAIFGIFGLTYILLKSPKIKGDKSQIRGLANQLGFFIVLNIVIGMSSKSISNEAHVGGLITGAIMAFIYLFEYPIQYRKIAGNVVAITLTTVVYFVWMGQMTPRESIIAEELRLPDNIHNNYGGISQRLMVYDQLLANDQLKVSDSLEFYFPMLKSALPEYKELIESNVEGDFSNYFKLLDETVERIEGMKN